jgi:putative ABC transport system permease protein
VGALGPVERDVSSVNPGAPPLEDAAFAGGIRTSAQTWDAFAAGLERIREEADSPVADVLAPARVITRSTAIALADDGTRSVAVAFDPDVRAHIALTAGDWPAPVAVDADVSLSGAAAFGAAASRAGARIQVSGPIDFVLSEASARELDWAVGQTRSLGGDAPAVRLSGIFAPTDPDDGGWQHARSILSPTISDDGNRPRTTAVTGFADPGSLAVLFALPARSETTIWYPVDTAAVTAGDAAAAGTALRRLTTASQSVVAAATAPEAVNTVRFATALPDAIDRARAQTRATAAVLALTVAGPFGVAATTLLLAARLVLDRRRSALRLLSARGASGRQLRAVVGAEGLLLGAVPAAVALALVGVATGAPPPVAAVVAVAVVALAPAALLVALAGTAAERAARADLGARGSRARLIAEGVVVVLAAAAVALLVGRGYSTADVDPLLAAAPLLVALAGALLVVRLYPVPLGALLRRAERGAGVTSFVGAARALREPALGIVPVLALVVGVAVAVSSGVVLSTLERGIRTSAEGRVGADLLVQGAAFDETALAAIRAVPGVAAATGASGAEPLELTTDGGTETTSAFVVDGADLADVQGARRGVLPEGARLDAGAGESVPIVMSGALADRVGTDGLVAGGRALVVVGVARTETPFSSRQNWIALDTSAARAVLGSDPADRSVLVRTAPDADTAAVAEAIRATSPAALRIQDPESIAAALEAGSAVAGLRVTLIAATAASAALGALALALTLGLAAGARRRALSLLRALGAPARAAAALVGWEIGPPAAAALVAGSALGAALPLLVLSAVDLRAFTASQLPPEYAVDPALLALTLGGFVVLTAAGAAVAVRLARRGVASASLRTVAEN